MNSVSWFIYIAQVSNSLGILFTVLGTIGLFCCTAYFAVPRINAFFESDDDFQGLPLQKGLLTLAIISLTVGNLMPEKNTMYAIAASQVGEQIVKTELASDATKALHSWIKKQIEPDKK